MYRKDGFERFALEEILCDSLDIVIEFLAFRKGVAVAPGLEYPFLDVHHHEINSICRVSRIV